jgi:hypothetical protein
MSTLWHLKADQTAGLCRAQTPEACPLGGMHFSSVAEARVASEELLTQEHSLLPHFAKLTSMPVKSFLDEFTDRTPLKNMNGERMVFALLKEAPDERRGHAIQLASLLHEGQLRGNRANLPKTPYIEHPLRCALRMQRLGVTDEATIISLINHDTVEDTSRRFAQLSTGEDDMPEERARELLLDFLGEGFGPEVRETVLYVTNEIPTPEEKAASIDEKQELYRRHAREAFAGGVRPFLTKTGDFVDNATGLKHSTGLGLARQGRMARKYNPLTDDIDHWADAYRDELPSEGARLQIHSWMEETRRSLDAIIRASE